MARNRRGPAKIDKAGEAELKNRERLCVENREKNLKDIISKTK